MTKADIAREWRSKSEFKGTPSAKLARIIFDKKDGLMFNDVEDVRNVLRYIEGKHGEKQKSKISKNENLSSFIVPNRTTNPYNLPKSDEESFKPYYIKGHERGLVFGDVHLPYQSNQAINAMIKFGLEYKPDFIFILGDLVDFHGVSYFLKDPRKKRFSEELEMAKSFIENLQNLFKCKIYYKFGNHEFRYDNFLLQKAHELKGVEEFELEAMFKKRCPDIEIIEDKTIVIINGLPFIHGHEFGRGLFSPVNSARGLFLQAKHSCVKGDSHTTSKHSEKDILGKLMITHSIGCLCGLTPRWLPLNKWNNGFSTIDLIGTNKYNFRNYEIYNGEVL